MAGLPYDLELDIIGLASNTSHTIDRSLKYSGPFSVCLENHNIFNRFFVIDCRNEDNFIIPALYAQYVVTLHKNNLTGIKRFIKPLYQGIEDLRSHRGAGTIISRMFEDRNYADNGCIKHTTSKGEVYYSLSGILFDSDFQPIMIPCYNIQKVDNYYYVTELVYRITNRIYGEDSESIPTFSNFLAKKMIPHLSKAGAFSNYNTGNLTPIHQPIPVRVEIGDLSSYICKPSDPSDNFEDEIFEMLKALSSDIVKSNM